MVSPDEQMHLVEISPRVVTDSVSDPVDTITARDGVVVLVPRNRFESSPAVNRMATLNLFATAGLSARTVPLLHGPVLITGADRHGKPIGLSDAQLKALKSGPEPNWWAKTILQARAHRSQHRRRARRPGQG